MTGSRPYHTLFFCLLLLSMFIFSGPPSASGQSQPTGQIAQVQNSLLVAFQAVRTAEQQGASNQSLAPLILELNKALSYEMIAEQGNTTAALESIDLSNDVASRAVTIGNQAQASAQDRTILAYLTAIILAIGSSIAILESDRVRRYVHKRRILRSRITAGDS